MRPEWNWRQVLANMSAPMFPFPITIFFVYCPTALVDVKSFYVLMRKILYWRDFLLVWTHSCWCSIQMSQTGDFSSGPHINFLFFFWQAILSRARLTAYRRHVISLSICWISISVCLFSEQSILPIHFNEIWKLWTRNFTTFFVIINAELLRLITFKVLGQVDVILLT